MENGTITVSLDHYLELRDFKIAFEKDLNVKAKNGEIASLYKSKFGIRVCYPSPTDINPFETFCKTFRVSPERIDTMIRLTKI